MLYGRDNDVVSNITGNGDPMETLLSCLVVTLVATNVWILRHLAATRTTLEKRLLVSREETRSWVTNAKRAHTQLITDLEALKTRMRQQRIEEGQ